jgi:hypothetical protein
MTIAHADRRTGYGELDRPTETTSLLAFWTGHSGFLIGFRTLDDGVMLTVQHRNLARGRARMPIRLVQCWRNTEEDIRDMLRIQKDIRTQLEAFGEPIVSATHINAVSGQR